jgi:Flp pilus assembly pilin Flp
MRRPSPPYGAARRARDELGATAVQYVMLGILIAVVCVVTVMLVIDRVAESMGAVSPLS